MVNAQEWLDREYSLEKRSELTELRIENKELEGKLELTGFFKLKVLNCSENNLSDLDLSDCRELEELYCYITPLTDTNFLSTLPNPGKLIRLDLGENNFTEQDLSFLRPFVGLESLQLWSTIQERINKEIYNRFCGSLKYLRNMKKLERLDIISTDIDSGLEYLAESKLERFPSIRQDWGKREGAKSEKIFAELHPYAINLKEGKYDLSAWKNARLIELSLEKDQLRNKISEQENQIENLLEKLEYSNKELLARKKDELEQLVNAGKGKLSEDFHGYLEIFLSVQKEDSIFLIAKKNLLKKLDEQELQALSIKQKEVNELAEQLSNLQVKEQLTQIQQIQSFKK